MNHYKRFRQTLALSIIMSMFVPVAAGVAVYVGLQKFVGIDTVLAALASAAAYLAVATVFYFMLLKTSSLPLQLIWQAVWHVSPERSDTPPPDLNKLRAGRELVSAMVMEIYNRASSTPTIAASPEATAVAPIATAEPAPAHASNILETVPLPILIFDKEMKIKAANAYAAAYLGLEQAKILGANAYDVLRLSFQSEDTVDGWLKTARESKATDNRTWEQVKLQLEDGTTKKLDLAASYSKDNSAGNEVAFILYDRSSSYNVQDQASSYIAMAVHELRTPLTMLRGYIELFEDELSENLSPEHKEFMHKMNAASQNLTAFVNNILNVARIDENQLTLTLTEANWSETLTSIINDMQNRAKVRGKRLQLTIQPDLPTVGIERTSIAEVVVNLLDNAIKYSGQSKDIQIEAKLGQDGLVETTITDHGAGMPSSVMNNLFTKFYRAHRSRDSVSGSGLGLYLVKSIVKAHGGNVTVSSKEGQGSTFGFSLQPYANIASEQKSDGSDGIQRQANGWIKNHSLYRR